MLNASSESLDIDLLVLPETNLILLASVIEPLRAANRIAGRDLYRWRLFTPEGAPIETTSRVSVSALGAFQPQREARPLFVLASYDWKRSATSALRMQLSQTARHRSMIAGIESGTWLLAEASLLDNTTVTTHWEDFEEFTAAYPQVRCVQERFVIDGKRMTSSGSLPTVDLMLEVIRRRQGYSLALEVGRLFSYQQVAPSRTDGVAAAGLDIRDPRVAQAVRMMEDNIEQPLVLSRLARRIGVSARHLQSLFQENFGAPPHEHYLALRLNAARRRVIETKASFADIAAATGFNSASAFSRSYRANFSESPTATRSRLRRTAERAPDRA